MNQLSADAPGNKKNSFWDEYFIVKNSLLKEKNTSYTSVRKRLRRVEKLVFNFRGTSIENKVLNYISPRHSKLTQKAYESGEVYLEGSLRNFIIKKMISEKLSLDEIIELLKKAPPIRRTFKYAGKEVSEAGVDSDSIVAHIGMGSLPETLLGIYDNKKNSLPKLFGVDMDIQAINEAQELLNILSLNKKIKLIHSNGSEIDYGKFSHILLAVLVRPEVETVKQICKTASKEKEVKVLLRTVDGLGNMVYQRASNESIRILLKNDFAQTGLVKGHVVMETMIFTRGPKN